MISSVFSFLSETCSSITFSKQMEDFFPDSLMAHTHCNSNGVDCLAPFLIMRETVKLSRLKILFAIPAKDKQTIFPGFCVQSKSHKGLKKFSGLLGRENLFKSTVHTASFPFFKAFLHLFRY